jgi:uncharacterized protein
MKLDNFLQLFVVKENKFYPFYTNLAETINSASLLLLKMFDVDNKSEREGLLKAIKKYETEGDVITKTIFEELYTSFVTPFDREDMNKLASEMDTFMDLIYDSSKRIVLFNPKSLDNNLKEIAEYIRKDSEELLAIVNVLSNLRNQIDFAKAKCNVIKDIEHSVDEIYDNYMSHIFSNEKDPIELIKNKSIVQVLEDTTDSAKTIADVIRTLIVKMA